MDIKDIILIGGGLLIAAVIAHGFWIAWRARRDPLRIDLVKDFAGDDADGDDIGRFRAELPNGGARVVAGERPRQASLELGADEAPAPILLDPSERERPAAGRHGKTEPRLGATARRPAGSEDAEPAGATDTGDADTEGPADPVGDAGHAQAPAARTPAAKGRGGVADVIMPERTIRADEPPKEPRRWSARRDPADVGENEQQTPARTSRRAVEAPGDSGAARGADQRPAPGRTQQKRAAASQSGSARGRGGASARGGEQPAEDVDELIMLNVLAPKGQPFAGGGMVEALRARGLRYGDMNIFHRVDPMTKASLYSVANVVEPGTFDMADLDNFRSPGVVFFMQLPGPEQPMDTFEDMLKVARDVAVRTGGSLLDENRSVMTGQTVEHYRQRITDYCRRRMSMRA